MNLLCNRFFAPFLAQFCVLFTTVSFLCICNIKLSVNLLITIFLGQYSANYRQYCGLIVCFFYCIMQLLAEKFGENYLFLMTTFLYFWYIFHYVSCRFRQIMLLSCLVPILTPLAQLLFYFFFYTFMSIAVIKCKCL